MVSMARRIRRARSYALLTQTELARRVGVARSAVAQWESSEGTSPSVENLAKVAVITNVCFEWLATGRGPSVPDKGAFDAVVALDDFARDSVESRVLAALRRLTQRRRLRAAQILELLD